jgi:hypothetical protein
VMAGDAPQQGLTGCVMAGDAPQQGVTGCVMAGTAQGHGGAASVHMTRLLYLSLQRQHLY